MNKNDKINELQDKMDEIKKEMEELKNKPDVKLRPEKGKGIIVCLTMEQLLNIVTLVLML